MLKLRLPVDGPTTGKFRQTEGYGYEHGGHDFGVPVGEPVCASADGFSVAFEWYPTGWDFGNWVRIDHGEQEICDANGVVKRARVFTAYAHLMEKGYEGDVKRGDIIGHTGNTGKSTGPHLHWAMSTNGYFNRNFDQLCDPMLHVGEGEDEPMTADEKKAFDELKARVDRIDNEGIVLYTDGQGYDVIAPVRELNADVLDITARIEALEGGKG